MSSTAIREIAWHKGPVPRGTFPLGRTGCLRLGPPWKWFVAAGTARRGRTLFAFDARKAEYRIWQGRDTGGGAILDSRLEHHGTAPGWHAHIAEKESESPFLAPRHTLAETYFPLNTESSFWRQSPMERLRSMFPLEPMPDDMVADITGTLSNSLEEVTVSPVPFGAAVALGGPRRLGDNPGFYIGRLGHRRPLFRLEDDGTTVPLLQAFKLLPGGPHIRPLADSAPARSGCIHFAPETRALFTPFFPPDELRDRARHFAEVLAGLWASLEHDLADRAAATESPGESTRPDAEVQDISSTSAQEHPVKKHVYDDKEPKIVPFVRKHPVS